MIVAVGGSSYPKTGTTGDGYEWMRDLGHTLVPLRSALAPMHLTDPRPQYSGVAFRDCVLKARAGVDRWLDWTLSTLQPVDRPVFWALVRTPPEQRDMVAIQKDADAEAVVWRIVEAQLATRRFIEGDQFTIADIALGAYARRWLGVEGITRPALPNLERWFAQFAARPGFVQYIAPPMT